MKFSVLASGSRGNACYVETSNVRVLVDAGLSCLEIEKRLEAISVPAPSINGILITHEHGDHIKGAGSFARRFGAPLYISPRTLQAARKGLGKLPETRPILPGEPQEVGDLIVEPYSKCHDCADPIGLTLSCDGNKIGFVTDLGRSTRLVEDRLKGCQALVIEFNHDPEMLNCCDYPLEVIRRIKGQQGHLSNQQGSALLEALFHEGLKKVVLAHLSEINNTVEKALQEATRILGRFGFSDSNILVARQDETGPVIEV